MTVCSTFSGHYGLLRLLWIKAKGSRLRNLRISAELRDRAFLRDKGICRQCGIDTIALHDAITYVHSKFEAFAPGWGHPPEFWEFKRAIGVRASRWPKSLWDVDHRIPVLEGGSDDLSNLQTLCLECHYRKTHRKEF